MIAANFFDFLQESVFPPGEWQARRTGTVRQALWFRNSQVVPEAQPMIDRLNRAAFNNSKRSENDPLRDDFQNLARSGFS